MTGQEPASFNAKVLRVLAVMLAGALLAFAPATALAQQPVERIQPARELQPQDVATQVNDLIAGKLSPEIDPADLFKASFAPARLQAADLVLRLVADADALRRAKAGADDPMWSNMPRDVVALAVARAEFLRLPEKQRQRLLSEHQAKREAAEKKAREASGDEQRVVALNQKADVLERFLAGQIVSLAALDFQLLDADEVALNASRRKAVTAPPNDTAAPPVAGAEPSPLVTAQARLDGLRARLLALPAEELGRLEKIQTEAPSQAATIARAQAEADTAARAAAAAAAEAQRADTEILKLIARQRSLLFSVQSAQAEFAAGLSRRDTAAKNVTEVMLRWRREVRELKARSRLDSAREQAADRVYGELVEALRGMRASLDASLGQAADNTPPGPQPLDSGLAPNDPATQALVTLRESLLVRARELEQSAQAKVQEERTALFDAMVDMNTTRLDLIPELSAAKRGQIVGFGEAGIAQVGRELNQITLTARYNIATAGQQVNRTLHPFLSPTPQTLFSLLQAGLAVFAFLVWRRAGNAVLFAAARSFSRRKPPTLISTALASVVTYYRKVRQPAELLVLLLLLRWTLNDVLVFVGDRIVWTALFWSLLGVLLVQLSDSLARDRLDEESHAALRMKSLKLLAGAGTGVGMALSITSELVGIGAIHNWVVSLCWLLAPLIVVILANWWRDRIHALAEKGAPKNAVLGLATRHRRGLFGQVMLVLAGAIIIAQGVWSVVARRMRAIALIREIADQRNRKRAVAQAAEDAASGKYEPISSAEAAVLEPHRPPTKSTRDDDGFPRSLSLRAEPGKIVAVVGERGLGKTTTLSHLLQSAPAGRLLRFQVDPGGASELRQKLDAEFAQDAKTERAADEEVACVVIDDTQRMIIPAIGGLRALDDLVAFARRDGRKVCWILAIGGPAMTYLTRARSDRSLFDEVSYLPRWKAADIRSMIERRTSQASFSPTFTHLKDLSFDALASEEDPEERGRRLYFDELTDYCGGNPAIALEFWRRSLFRNVETGQVEVRTFARPAAEVLGTLPEPTIFVLRTLVQIEQTDMPTIQACTDYSNVVVSEAVHRLRSMGVIECAGEQLRIALLWYVEVVRLLERQNLLVRSAA